MSVHVACRLWQSSYFLSSHSRCHTKWLPSLMVIIVINATKQHVKRKVDPNKFRVNVAAEPAHTTYDDTELNVCTATSTYTVTTNVTHTITHRTIICVLLMTFVYSRSSTSPLFMFFSFYFACTVFVQKGKKTNQLGVQFCSPTLSTFYSKRTSSTNEFPSIKYQIQNYRIVKDLKEISSQPWISIVISVHHQTT